MHTNRPQIVEKLFNQKHLLSLQDPVYKQWVFKYTFLELEKDLDDHGDITTDGLLKGKANIIARVYANERGIMAGGEEIEYFVSKSDPVFKPGLGIIRVTKRVKDGKSFEKDDVLMELQGDAKDILKAERTILNLLQHMSGIATRGKEIVEKAKKKQKDILITPTRKTTWGLLDKKALCLAGCGTHRLNLSNAVLIKDNHLSLFENNIKKVLFEFHPPTVNYTFFEIEIDDAKKVLETAKILREMQKNRALPDPAVIMFDNMPPEKVKHNIAVLKTEKLHDNILIEVSGGVSSENIEEYAKTGADIISMGSLTQKITPVDLSLEVKNIG